MRTIWKLDECLSFDRIQSDTRLLSLQVRPAASDASKSCVQLISIIEHRRGIVQFDETAQTLRLNGTLTVAVVVIPYSKPETDSWGWTLRLYYFPKCDLIFAGRMDNSNTKILDYFLLPRSACPRTILRFTERNLARFNSYKLASLSEFFAIAAQHSGATARDSADHCSYLSRTSPAQRVR